MTKKAIILLSGGLDSLVSLDIAIKKYNVVNSLTFDYGQKAFKEEKDAAKKIAKYYGIKNEVIKLSFLKDILDNALVDDKKQDLNDFSQIWIPNRNGLFLNIAACYCDKYEIDCIVFGANKEEAEKFSDNSLDFIKTSDKFFKYSTQKKSKVYAPCQDFDKIEIINYAVNNNLPIKLLKSCYDSKNNSGKKHCGKCMSCKLLKNAILQSGNKKLIKEIF